MRSIDEKAYNERLENLSKTLAEGDEIDNYILIQLNKRVMAKPKKIGNGPEAEYHCPDCGKDLIDYLGWKDDKFCDICGKRIKKKKATKTAINYDYLH